MSWPEPFSTITKNGSASVCPCFFLDYFFFKLILEHFGLVCPRIRTNPAFVMILNYGEIVPTNYLLIIKLCNKSFVIIIYSCTFEFIVYSWIYIKFFQLSLAICRIADPGFGQEKKTASGSGSNLFFLVSSSIPDPTLFGSGLITWQPLIIFLYCLLNKYRTKGTNSRDGSGSGKNTRIRILNSGNGCLESEELTISNRNEIMLHL